MGEDYTGRFDMVATSNEGKVLIEKVRQSFKDLCLQIEAASEPGRAFAVALTELEAAHRAANRAIAEAHRAE